MRPAEAPNPGTSSVIPDPTMRPTMPLWPDVGRGVIGLGRSATYEAAARGEIPTLRFGRRVVVPVGHLRRVLGVDPDASPSEREEAPVATTGAPISACPQTPDTAKSRRSP